MSTQKSVVSKDEINEFFQKAFGHRADKVPPTILAEHGRAVVTMDINENMLRPGGFISGPTQMAMADHAAYIAIFTMIGITPMALTSNLNINFLRPCQGELLTADAVVLKLGKSLAVINVEIKGSSSDKASSQSVVTYALPKTD